MKAKQRVAAGKLFAGMIAARDEAVLNNGGTRCESIVYDFAVDGGAVGLVACKRFLPAGAIVTAVLADELTNVTSGGLATLQLKAGAIDLIADTAIASFNGLTAPALVGPYPVIKLAADSELKVSIETAAITAGKVRFFVRYLLPND